MIFPAATTAVPLTEAHDARARRLTRDAAYATTCGCGLRSLVAVPCGGRRLGHWALGCENCRLRAFVPRRSAIFFLFALGDDLGRLPVDERATVLAAARSAGQRLLARAEFTTLVLQGKRKQVATLSTACVACGQPGATTLRLDRYQRPYVACGGCAALAFLYSSESAEFMLGLSELVATEALSWLDHFERGEGICAAWLPLASAPPAIGMENAAAAEVTSAIHR